MALSQKYHPVADRVLFVSQIPLEVSSKQLSELFDLILGEKSCTLACVVHWCT